MCAHARVSDSLLRETNTRRETSRIVAEADLLREQRDRLSAAVNALTTNTEDLLIKQQFELHEQQERKKSIPSTSRARICAFISAAYDHLEADSDDSAKPMCFAGACA